jgi:pyruvate dehydrogenase E2 component (dihydrolipoyllysine-residue acetyltransferase)
MLDGMIDPSAMPAPAAGVKGAVRIEEPDRSERTIARRSAEARATVPDIELTAEVDPAAHIAHRLDPHALTAALLDACALALKEVPRANGAYRDGRFELYSRINIGVILATDEAYTIPTVFDCDRKSIPELAGELAALEKRARASELLAPELTGATFTLWNPGAFGVASATPVIVPPQAGALAAGAIREVPSIRDGAIVPAHAMTITIACDHRILYGTDAARFLATIKARLEAGSR